MSYETGYETAEEYKRRKKGNFLKILIFTVLFSLVAGFLYFESDSIEKGFKDLKELPKQLQELKDNAKETLSPEKEEASVSETSESSEGESLAASVEPLNLSVTTGDVSAVVQVGMPSIVSINTTILQTSYSFFGFPNTYESTASGSGFLIGQDSTSLIIATNNHVIEDANTIQVTFEDGTSAEAEVRGSDKYYDLAVITVKTKDLSKSTLKSIRIANLGDSDALEVGSLSIAIGNALGYGQSTTVGYISAIDREVTIDGITMTLIQTDAAINPGNSGGPLFNALGQVIGINSVKYSDTSVEGMGYAIPISRAIPIFNALINSTQYSSGENGFLGISGKDITSTYSAAFGLPVGVYVYEICDDSPALAAGIQPGDIITGINGRTVTTCEELKSILAYTQSESTISLTIKRRAHSGRFSTVNVNVTLGAMPENTDDGSF